MSLEKTNFTVEIIPPTVKGVAFSTLDNGAWFSFEGRLYLKRYADSVFSFDPKLEIIEALAWYNMQLHVIPCKLCSLQVKQL